MSDKQIVTSPLEPFYQIDKMSLTASKRLCGADVKNSQRPFPNG